MNGGAVCVNFASQNVKEPGESGWLCIVLFSTSPKLRQFYRRTAFAYIIYTNLTGKQG